MSDVLTPERRAELRRYVQQGDWYRLMTDDEMLAMLDAADEAARLRWYKDHAQKLAGEMTRRCEQVEKLREALAGLRAQVNYDLHDQSPAWNAAIRAADDALITTAPTDH